MEPALISIAVCTYNGEKYLREQLDSLTEQDYPSLEIVIVDDCSSDGTYTLLEQYQQRNDQIRLYKNEENLGFNKNFARALSLCKGSFIAIADQDDIWDLHKISLMMASIDDNLLLYHDSAIIDHNGSLTGKMSDGHRFVKGQCTAYLLYNNSISGHACFFNKELLSHTGPFPENMYYDWWMAYTAACLGRLDFIMDTLVYHRRHLSNSTVKDTINDKDRRVRNLNIFRDHPLNPKETEYLISKLLHAYQLLLNTTFSFYLCYLLIANSEKIFYTRKKSLFSRIKFIIKESQS
ncbi:glycosyltransferase [Pedobacter sp. MR2016-24]|uniref:glycosyltransferase n=1 Tax=Pedobacter sp. MR2016-24 TaxID=2994466 RepID=UPI002247566E|nr:glycosyltransferase [Pedobacter sp. MR2016-24]MCX2482122.1 glycosyltransferase [Pedobacter sp. MR2016-24]